MGPTACVPSQAPSTVTFFLLTGLHLAKMSTHFCTCMEDDIRGPGFLHIHWGLDDTTSQCNRVSSRCNSLDVTLTNEKQKWKEAGQRNNHFPPQSEWLQSVCVVFSLQISQEIQCALETACGGSRVPMTLTQVLAGAVPPSIFASFLPSPPCCR